MSNEFKEWTLKNSNGIKITVLNIGGAIRKWEVPIGDEIRDIVLGYDKAEDYEVNKSSFGVLIGRYANRINKGRFNLNRKENQLTVNNDGNHLHGGATGFGRRIWSGLQFSDQRLRLSYFSPDGEEGYPGNLDVRVDYELADDNLLTIKYWARTDQDTIINLTNHSYFNLMGHDHGSVLDHNILINSNTITQNDASMIPTGEFKELGSSIDIQKISTVIQKHFNDNQGIDDNFILDGNADLACKLVSPDEKLSLEIKTSEPGIQVFTSNFEDLTFRGKDDVTYGHQCAVALETQHFPDSPNHEHFPDTVLKEGKEFNSQTSYKLIF